MQDVKIELKSVDNQVAELEVVKKKAEYLTKQRILQQQEAAKLKELEKSVTARTTNAETAAVAPAKNN